MRSKHKYVFCKKCLSFQLHWKSRQQFSCDILTCLLYKRSNGKWADKTKVVRRLHLKLRVDGVASWRSQPQRLVYMMVVMVGASLQVMAGPVTSNIRCLLSLCGLSLGSLMLHCSLIGSGETECPVSGALEGPSEIWKFHESPPPVGIQPPPLLLINGPILQPPQFFFPSSTFSLAFLFSLSRPHHQAVVH